MQLLLPPIAFLAVLIAILVLSKVLARLSFKKTQSQESGESYACGEDFQEHSVQPDYSQFFPFAYFFTILHVAVLMIATVPEVNIGTFIAVIIYILGVALGLYTLLRRK